MSGAVWAQVETAEVQGVETAAAHSRGLTAWSLDGSVGEVTILVRALDSAGNPVAGAEVTWTVQNRTDNVVFAVGMSGMMDTMSEPTYNGMAVSFDGGVTDENGETYFIVDSQTAGDARVFVTIGGVEGKTYRGRDMRVVWF